LASATDILAGMSHHKPSILWIILPPEASAQLSDLADGYNALPEQLGRKQLKRMNRDPLYKKRVFQTAEALTEHFDTRPGWGEWPPDPHECLAVGMVLGLWLERDVPEILLDLPEEALAELEEECRERGVSTEQVIIDRLTASRSREADPADWWKGEEA
jgi:hypothetical protein